MTFQVGGPTGPPGTRAESVDRRLGRNLLWTGLGTGAEKAIVFLATIWLARALGVESFGGFAAAQTFALAFWTVLGFGLARHGTLAIARDRERAATIHRELFGLRLLVLIGLGLLFVVVVGLVPPISAGRIAALAAGLAILASALNPDWALRGLERFRAVAIGALVGAISFVVLVWLLVRDESDLVTAVVAWGGSLLIGAVVLLIVLRIQGWPLSPLFGRSSRAHGRAAMPFLLGGAVSTLLNLVPILVLDWSAGALAVGLFAAPMRIGQLIARAAAMTQTAIFPALAASRDSGSDFRAIVKRNVGGMAAVAIGVVVVGWPLAERLVLWSFGSAYLTAVPILRIVLVATALRLVRAAVESVLAATDRQGDVVVATAAGLLTLVAVFLVRGEIGAFGMAIAVLAGEALTFVAMVTIPQVRGR